MENKASPSNARPPAEERRVGRWIVGIGIAWMMLGLVVMPAGASFNPGRIYQYSLTLLLYLPALVLTFTGRARVWRQLWPLPAFRVFLVLLAWAALSLSWSTIARPAEEVGRLLSVLAFVLGWHVYAADEPRRIRALLLPVGLLVSVCALFYCVRFLTTPSEDGRIVGEGTIATANYAAALMGATALYLSQLPVPAVRLSVLRHVAIGFLLVFVLLTQSRSVWLALGLAILLMPAWQAGRSFRWLAAGVLLIGLYLVVRPVEVLTERGTSLRPELFMQSLHLIAQHPLLGLGQGAPFNLPVNGQVYVHTHNLLTQVTVELGLPGLLLTVVLWCMVAWQGWLARATLQGRLILALWVFASVVLQFDMPQMLDSPRPAWLLVWLPFALSLGLAWRRRGDVSAISNDFPGQPGQGSR